MATSKQVKLNALLNLRAKQNNGYVLDKDFTNPAYVPYLIRAKYVKRIDPVPVLKYTRLELTDLGREKLATLFEVGV